MIELALFLKRSGYRPRQVQDFIPAPMDLATSAWHTGLDPHSLKPLPVRKRLSDRRMQRALMQFFKPENWFEVEAALRAAGREDLIGNGPDCLIRTRPPQAAQAARAGRRGEEFGRFVHERGLLPPERSGRPQSGGAGKRGGRRPGSHRQHRPPRD
jgi:hypothetical protein